jgi:dolichol-phosphate mannosyltransferase
MTMRREKPSVSTQAVVVIPTYNEAESIEELLDALRRTAPDVDVLVVDDGSPDGTADIVRRHGTAHLLSRDRKSGLGDAYRAGFAWALRRGYRIVAQMDADLSHPPERLGALITALTNADVAVGSRYVRGGGIDAWTWLRRLISAWGNLFARVVLGLRVHDATAGYKAFRRSALIEIGVLDSTSDGYCFQIENAWRSEQNGLRVTEVPIRFTDRTQGASKMSSRIVVEALLRVVQWRIRKLVGAQWPELSLFAAVGACGFIVDVAAFSTLQSLDPFRLWDPTVARTLAMGLAMCVTYVGHRTLTWRHEQTPAGPRELGLFTLLNLVGLAISNACLVVSHDILGLTSLVADNISANVIGLALGSGFRFLTYRRYVFTQAAPNEARESEHAGIPA